jgi:hypothetical protein
MVTAGDGAIGASRLTSEVRTVITLVAAGDGAIGASRLTSEVRTVITLVAAGDGAIGAIAGSHQRYTLFERVAIILKHWLGLCLWLKFILSIYYLKSFYVNCVLQFFRTTISACLTNKNIQSTFQTVF